MRLAAALSLLARLVSAHMELKYPAAINSKYSEQTAEGDIDYSYTSPLAKDGADYPCKGYATKAKFDALSPEATLQAGESFTWELSGSAVHNGGSCQIGISYDPDDLKNGVVVIASFIGGCPMNDDQKYTFTVPKDLPAAEKAIFSWSWINHTGNREYYNNCAIVAIESSSSSFTGPRNYLANIFGDGVCEIAEGIEVVYPNPGDEVVYGGEYTGQKPTASTPTPDGCDYDENVDATVTGKGAMTTGAGSGGGAPPDGQTQTGGGADLPATDPATDEETGKNTGAADKTTTDGATTTGNSEDGEGGAAATPAGGNEATGGSLEAPAQASKTSTSSSNGGIGGDDGPTTTNAATPTESDADPTETADQDSESAVSDSDTDSSTDSGGGLSSTAVIAIAVVSGIVILAIVAMLLYRQREKSKKSKSRDHDSEGESKRLNRSRHSHHSRRGSSSGSGSDTSGSESSGSDYRH